MKQESISKRDPSYVEYKAWINNYILTSLYDTDIYGFNGGLAESLCDSDTIWGYSCVCCSLLTHLPLETSILQMTYWYAMSSIENVVF